jgi:pteridine reductase
LTKNKVALVTGAAKRIGAHIAETLHAEGYNLIVHYRRSAQAALQLVEKLNAIRSDSAIAIQADLNTNEHIQSLVDESVQKWCGLDLLVNNASDFFPTPLSKIDQTQWQTLMGSNAKAPLFLSQAVAPALKARHGVIINLLDVHIQRPLPQHTVYCMAKAAQATMTLSLANELAPEIRVNGISPGAILWPDHPLTEQQKQDIVADIPANTLGQPQDIAQAVLYLARANYVTGHILNVDGGRSIANNQPV